MISVPPADLVVALARTISDVKPRGQDLLEVRKQLLARKAKLGLKDRVATEYVAESYFRCIITDQLQRDFGVEFDEIPSCINSSHTATRCVCWNPSRHRHHQIADADWAKFKLAVP